MWPVTLALAAAASAAAPACPAAPSATAEPTTATHWNFTVLLDGQPVGMHHYALTGSATDPARVVNDAQFELRLLGVPVYRYRHHAVERWQAGCLESVDARTDDNGYATEVQGRVNSGRLEVGLRAGGATRPTRSEVPVDGCVMGFAYWTPRIEGQHALLDPGSGKLTPVTVRSIGSTVLAVDGADTEVRGLRLEGLANPIDVWYAGDRWVGLDTTVRRDHRLSYRLR